MGLAAVAGLLHVIIHLACSLVEIKSTFACAWCIASPLVRIVAIVIIVRCVASWQGEEVKMMPCNSQAL